MPRSFRVILLAVLAAGLAILALGRAAHAQKNLFEVYRDQYVIPRSYPDSSISDSTRARAYHALVNRRLALGTAHRFPAWSDSALVGGPVVGPCLWTSAGPTNINGRVTSIAYDLKHPDILFSTTVGGIWRSKDGGRRWHRVSDNLNDLNSAPPAIWASVAVNPMESKEVFAGSGDPNFAVSIFPGGRDSSAGQGIWRSESGGDVGTWFKVSPTELDRAVIFRLRVAPQDPNDVYAATSFGIWKGVHGANLGDPMTWSRLGNLDDKCSDVVVDFAASPRRVYAGVCEGTEPGIYKWDPGLAQVGTPPDSWHRRTGNIPATIPIGAIALAMDPSDPNRLYAKVARSDNGHHHGFYTATDAGAGTTADPGSGPHWSVVAQSSTFDDSPFGAPSPNAYCWYNNVVEVDPRNPAHLLAGGKFLYRSTDHGETWSQISLGAASSFPHLHDDQHAVAFHPDGDIAIVGNDGGLDRNTGFSKPGWHWEHISHGMTTGQYFAVTSTENIATAIAAGAQDNGGGVTYGNRTWYHTDDCDAYSVAMDAANGVLIYETCNGDFRQRINPVTGTEGAGFIHHPNEPTTDTKLGPPFAADPGIPLSALCAGFATSTRQQSLCKTTNGIDWSTVGTPLPVGKVFTCFAIDPASSFAKFYAGVRTQQSTPAGATVFSNATGTWTEGSGVPVEMSPNAIVVDPSATPTRAFLGLGGNSGGAVALSLDQGLTWNVLGVQGLAAIGPVTGLAIDPIRPDVLYAATMVGVLRGTFKPATGSTGPAIEWVPFDDGLPDAPDVSGIWVNPVTQVLSISTMGYGIFRRDIPAEPQCHAHSLLVRDNVFDQGSKPSPDGPPDPERPERATGDAFFHAGPPVRWWRSTDIRVEVPGTAPAQNSVPLPGVVASTPVSSTDNKQVQVDHVEMESCPVHHTNCPAGTMIDTKAIRGQRALVHVQVINQGYHPVSNVRVLALWASAGAGLPLLPDDLWSTRFPANVNTCPEWVDHPDWHAVDTLQPCHLIETINPDVPEVVTFEWEVPTWADEHSCMMAIVEGSEDPIDPAVRSAPELRPWVLVPDERHVAQRNLHLLDDPGNGTTQSANVTLKFWNPTRDTSGIDLVLSRSGLPPSAELCVVLPSGRIAGSRGAARCHVISGKVRWMDALRRKLKDKGPTAAYSVKGKEAVFEKLHVPPGEAWTIGIHYENRRKRGPAATQWFDVTARQDTTILGGSTYLIRPSRELIARSTPKPPRRAIPQRPVGPTPRR